MNSINKIRYFNTGALLAGCAAALLFSMALSGANAETATPAATGQKVVQSGESIYRKGILPSGDPVQTFVKSDTTVPGISFACVSCHLRSGLGAVEGGVNTPPANTKTLYQARDKSGSGNNRRNSAMPMGSPATKRTVVQPPPARPAYNDETLANVLRNGRDPSGRVLDSAMPRYNLGDQDMTNLISYLKSLSVEYSPGVDQYGISFATVVTDEVSPEMIDAIMLPVESFVANANRQQMQLEEQQVNLLEFPTDVTYRRIKHARWILKGNPDTWRSQLEAYYKKEPVFALIGGISTKEWQPVHEFSEEHAIPSILPNTDLPVVSESEQYTLYFSKGYYQEGEAAARYLLTTNSSSTAVKIVQIVAATPQGKALSAGFMNDLKNDPAYSVTTVQRNPDEPLSRSFLQQLLEQEKPDVLALWTGAGSPDEMAIIPEIASADIKLIMSSTVLGSRTMTIPEQLRDKTFITYPFRLPQDQKRYERLIDQKLSDNAKALQSKTYSMLLVLTQALREMKGDFYRDYLLDLIGMRPDIDSPLYERLSFGPDRKYISKGCYVVQLTKGSNPELIKKSAWVIQ